MKVKKIRISCLDNSHALNFYEELRSYLNEINTLPFEILSDRFNYVVDVFKKSFLVYHKNVLIKQIKLEQRNLQHSLMSIKYRLKKNLDSTNPAVVRLSQKAIIILEYYYTSKHVSVFRKDDKIFNIVDALEDFLTERERVEIGISTYLKNLKRVNNQMKELIQKRDSIPVEETSQNLMLNRHEADVAYRELIHDINLRIKKFEENIFVNEMVEKLNRIITNQSGYIKSSPRHNVPAVEQKAEVA
ncbi:MAG: hypothetical protein LUE98_11595 [Tannerellaceae bacterium]|nr:hypothetical protein [Tannerellaceae bacterium]MCD8178023.1 hypothetical protein [Tannerellaceae bacterium]